MNLQLRSEQNDRFKQLNSLLLQILTFRHNYPLKAVEPFFVDPQTL